MPSFPKITKSHISRTIEFLKDFMVLGAFLDASFTPKCMEITEICGTSWILHNFMKVQENHGKSQFPVNLAFWGWGALQNH